MHGNLYLFLRRVKLFGVWSEFLLGANISNKYNKLKDFHRMSHELKIKFRGNSFFVLCLFKVSIFLIDLNYLIAKYSFDRNSV